MFPRLPIEIGSSRPLTLKLPEAMMVHHSASRKERSLARLMGTNLWRLLIWLEKIWAIVLPSTHRWTSRIWSS